MTRQQITAEALALPLAERVLLAQELWASLDSALVDDTERAAIAEAIRHDEELSSGAVLSRTNGEVMQATKPALVHR